jgi:hypothetical protein
LNNVGRNLDLLLAREVFFQGEQLFEKLDVEVPVLKGVDEVPALELLLCGLGRGRYF